ncbi:MAG: hypothetical protein KAZ88_12415 [Acidimicrobiia bacterium]|nr:hypothetical protein [Acidimicrobiia bacterium]
MTSEVTAPTLDIRGPVRVDKRTKDLIKRCLPGEIAVIDHVDIDRVAAEGLIGAKVSAVINGARSVSGRYPNVGPLLLVEAGIPLIDDAGSGLLDLVNEGQSIRLVDGAVWRGDECLATGVVQTAPALRAQMEAAHEAIGEELRKFASNTLDYIDQEAHLAFQQLTLPPLKAKFSGRHALIVVRGYDYRDDLKALRSYIREFKPVLIGVDGGADALLEFGLVPDLIIGDFDSVSFEAVGCGADLVHHVHPDGRAPGRENLQEWKVEYHEFVASGTSEDVAMMLAYEAGAELIVAVGTHATMIEFLDKGRKGMASTFLTRMRLGPVLVDAKGVSRLYESRVRRTDIFLLVASALVAVLAIALVAEPFQVFWRGIWLTITDAWYSLTS